MKTWTEYQMSRSSAEIKAAAANAWCDRLVNQLGFSDEWKARFRALDLQSKLIGVGVFAKIGEENAVYQTARKTLLELFPA